jgi:hypothetical protein
MDSTLPLEVTHNSQKYPSNAQENNPSSKLKTPNKINLSVYPSWENKMTIEVQVSPIIDALHQEIHKLILEP